MKKAEPPKTAPRFFSHADLKDFDLETGRFRPVLLDRMEKGPGSERVASLVPQIVKARGDWDRLEQLLRKSDIARTLRLIAEDAYAKWDEATPTEDSIQSAQAALKQLAVALTEARPGPPMKRAVDERKRGADILRPWVERIWLVMQALKEQPSEREPNLAKMLAAQPELLVAWGDLKQIKLDPGKEARRLLKDYRRFIRRQGFKKKTDIERYFGITVSALRKRAAN